MDVKSFVLLTFIFYILSAAIYLADCEDSKGVEIGMTCTKDQECRTGNGGPFSKCHKPSSTCICTVNITGHNKCNLFEDNSFLSLFMYINMSSLECSHDNDSLEYPMFFQMQIPDFAGVFVNDQKTSFCFDPNRTFHTVPEGIEIRKSPLHGFGAFTNIFIKKGTIFGPAKGLLTKGNACTEASKWSWKIYHRDASGEDVWFDGRHMYLSNWLRFVNMAPTVQSSNMAAIMYEEMIYYYVFRSVQPGTELLAPYGYKSFESELEQFTIFQDNGEGFVGGYCNNPGQECKNDPNSFCFGMVCVCQRGFHRRQDICVKDGTVGGICSGSDGELCEHDLNAECQGGVCVCSKATSIVKGKCLPDETYGGRCNSPNGIRCVLDPNTECLDGLCQCSYGSMEINGKCTKSDMFGGRCVQSKEGEPCKFDNNSICHKGFCLLAQT